MIENIMQLMIVIVSDGMWYCNDDKCGSDGEDDDDDDDDDDVLIVVVSINDVVIMKSLAVMMVNDDDDNVDVPKEVFLNKEFLNICQELLNASLTRRIICW